MPDDLPIEARPPITTPGLKHDNRLETLLNDQTFDDLSLLASSRGVSKSELARRIIEQHLYGNVAALRAQLRNLD